VCSMNGDTNGAIDSEHVICGVFAVQPPSLSVTNTPGTYRRPLSRLPKNRLAATAFRRDCTRTSSTLPCWSTARHSYRSLSLIPTNTSSRCHVSPGRGRRRRTWLA
jgi:hypothetical protein